MSDVALDCDCPPEARVGNACACGGGSAIRKRGTRRPVQRNATRATSTDRRIVRLEPVKDERIRRHGRDMVREVGALLEKDRSRRKRNGSLSKSPSTRKGGKGVRRSHRPPEDDGQDSPLDDSKKDATLRGTCDERIAWFALNEVNFFYAEDGHGSAGANTQAKFGSHEAIVKDLDALGIDAGHHPGRLQFYLSDILAPVGGVFPASLADLQQALRDCTPMQRLRDLLEHIRTSGSGVRLFLTLMENGEDAPDLADVTSISTEDRRTYKGIQLQWHEDHHGNTLSDFFTGESFDYDTATGTDPGERAWDKYSLDISNGYKRAWLKLLALVWAYELDQMRNDFRYADPAFDIADTILGVEIFNEIEGREMVIDAIVSGEVSEAHANYEDWADVFYGCALMTKLATQDSTGASWLKVWLPGLQSYRPDLDPADTPEVPWEHWTEKRKFMEYLLARVAVSAHADRRDVSEVVDGLDYHYFHRFSASLPNERQNKEGVQRLAWLYADIQDLRGLLDDIGLGEAVITMFPTGVNVLCEKGEREPVDTGYERGCDSLFWASYPVPPATPTVRPDNVQCDDLQLCLSGSPGDATANVCTDYAIAIPVGANDFQGMSVWWRWSVALAAGAAAVGWHQHVTGIPDEADSWMAHGLRKDLDYGWRWDMFSGLQLHDVAPSEVHQRVSWWVVRRFISLLGCAKKATVVLPAPTSGLPETHEELGDREAAGTWTARDDVWVIEFTPRSKGGSYAYLLFVDPYGAADCAEVTFQRSGSGTLRRVTEYATHPDAVTLEYGGDADEFPQDTWTASPAARLTATSGRLTLSLGRSEWPRLIASSSRLAVRSKRVYAS